MYGTLRSMGLWMNFEPLATPSSLSSVLPGRIPRTKHSSASLTVTSQATMPYPPWSIPEPMASVAKTTGARGAPTSA